MKVSLANFKSIKKLSEFDLKPLTILSGTNSTGKSSLIQFILLIKQTVELESPNFPIALNGEYYQVNSFDDLLRNQSNRNKIMAEFSFDKPELINLPTRIKIFDALNYSCQVKLLYDTLDNKPYISEFTIRYILEGDQKKDGQFVSFLSSPGRPKTFSIHTNNELFVKGVWNAKAQIESINFSGIYPTSYDIVETVTADSPSGAKVEDPRVNRYFSNLDSVKNKIDSFFTNISYIGPLREAPKDTYNIRGYHKSVGSAGEFAAEVFESLKDSTIELFKPEFSEDGIRYSLEKMTFLQAVRFWICDIFNLGRDIIVTKVEDSYSIIIVGNSGLQTTIKHVGFGVSQVLPIIIEGLRLKPGATLALEQPEIHLHPKIQSLLFDFLRSLVLNGINVIIETHSDHFITRLRRRIAEDSSSKLQLDVNLTFIEPVGDEMLFRTIAMDDSGVLEYFPPNFMEEPGIETKAILKAQLKKRSQKK